jgi:hypothetical protein
MRYVDNLLKELEGTPNLGNVISKLEREKTDNWESYLTELKIARRLKALHPEFIKEGKNKTPDLKSLLSTKQEVFFEVKLFCDTDPIWNVKKEVEKINSNFQVYIHLYPDIELYKNQADKLIEYIKDKIESGSIGLFTYKKDEIEVTVTKKKANNQRTLFMLCHSKGNLDDKNTEQLRRIIRSAFNKKAEQLMSRKPIYWVIDCDEKWGYDIIDFKKALYGDSICTGRTILELFNEHFVNLKNTPNQFDNRGLFFQEDAKCMNGVIVTTEGDIYLLNNPFASQQLDSNSMRELKDGLFSVSTRRIR